MTAIDAESKKQKGNRKFWHPICKKDIILILIFSVAFAFNIFIFNQIDVILHNQNEFGVSASEVIWTFIGYSLLLFAFIAGLLLFLCSTTKIGFKTVFGILLGITVATYIQVLIFNGNHMNSMDGAAVYSGVSMFMVILNAMIFLAFVGAPSVIFLACKKHQNKIKKAFLIISVMIFGMQFVGVTATSFNAEKLGDEDKYYYFSIDDYLKISDKENISVFIMDRLTTKYVELAFETWPEESLKILNGFTWYKNNLSQYANTFPSVSTTLTSTEFTNSQSQSEFMPMAWSNNKIFKALKEKNYTVNALLDSYSTYYNLDDIVPDSGAYFDNIKMVSKSDTVLRKNTVFEKTTQIALMRNMPFIFKNHLTVGDYSNLPNMFLDLSNNAGYYPKAASPETDLYFYDYLKDNGLSITDNTESAGTFNLIHLNSAHTPIRFDKDFNPKHNNGIQGTDLEKASQALGSLKILGEYLEQMKKLKDVNDVSLFDKSTIIVMADHGYRDIGINDDIYDERKEAFASLFIKRANDNASAELQINETAQTSTRNFAPTILQIIGANNYLDANDRSYYDVIDNPVTETRYFSIIKWAGTNGDFKAVSTIKSKYKITGDAFKDDSWEKIPV